MGLSSVARSQFLLVSAHAGRLMLSIVIISMLGRMLTPADFGFITLVSSLFVVAMELLDMGTTAVATREIAARPACEREVLTTLMSLRRLVGAVLFVAAAGFALGGYVAQTDQRLALVGAAFGIYILHFHGYQAVFQVRQSFGMVVSLGLAGQVTFLVASFVALKFHAGGAAITLLVVAREIVQAFGSRWIAIRMLGYRLRVPWRHAGMGQLLKSGWMVGVAGVCYKLTLYSGGFFLWGMTSPESLATFGAAQRLLAPMADMAWLFATPLIASLSAAAAQDAGGLRVQLEGYAKFVLGMSALVATGGYFLAPFVLRLLYGEQYASGPWSSVGVFRWLTAGYLFALVTPVLAVGELAQRNAGALMRIGIAGLGLNAAMNAWLVPLHGAEGAAMALCASESLVFCTLLARSVARGDVGLGGSWFAYLVPAIVLGAILWLLEGSPFAQLVAAGIVTPAFLVATLQLPAQKACRASQAAVSAQWPQSAGPLTPTTASDSR